MILQRPAADRGHVRTGWLDSRHTFSFGHYHDPQWMGFGPLRVINEDRVAPGAGFPPHRHANMEILSYVLSGALAHRDDSGGQGVLRPGELQWMSAGHGIEHSEFNASQDEPVHFLQIWIQPDCVNAAPAYGQRGFDLRARPGQWVVMASPDGVEGSIAIRQRARLLGAALEGGQELALSTEPARRYWLHVATGEVEVDHRHLAAGAALGLTDEGGVRKLTALGPRTTELLLFELDD